MPSTPTTASAPAFSLGGSLALRRTLSPRASLRRLRTVFTLSPKASSDSLHRHSNGRPGTAPSSGVASAVSPTFSSPLASSTSTHFTGPTLDLDGLSHPCNRSCASLGGGNGSTRQPSTGATPSTSKFPRPLSPTTTAHATPPLPAALPLLHRHPTRRSSLANMELHRRAIRRQKSAWELERDAERSMQRGEALCGLVEPRPEVGGGMGGGPGLAWGGIEEVLRGC